MKVLALSWIYTVFCVTMFFMLKERFEFFGWLVFGLMTLCVIALVVDSIRRDAEGNEKEQQG